MGNFVSFSVKNADCSWYEACEFGELQKVGAGYVSKVLHSHGEPTDELYALGMRMHNDATARSFDADEERQGTSADDEDVVLLVSKSDKPMRVTLDGAALASAQVLEARGAEPGMAPPFLTRADAKGTLTLGPFAVVLVALGHGHGE